MKAAKRASGGRHEPPDAKINGHTRQAGEVLRMKEPDGEGLASHTGPESCEGGSNAALEALTGVRAGRVLSLVMSSVQGADAFRFGGRPHDPSRHREGRTGPAGSKAPGTHGHTSRGSREISGLTPPNVALGGVRALNPKGMRVR